MKPFEWSEQCGLQIDSANELRCKQRDEGLNTCGSCQSCLFSSRLSASSRWLARAGLVTRRRFLTGLLARCHTVSILENIHNILHVTFGKDFTYTRSRLKPGLPEDLAAWSSDRALDTKRVGLEMVETWAWFSRSHPWTQSNYLLGILSLCDTELLHMLGNLTSVLLVREKRAFPQYHAHADEPGDDASSIPESSYSFNSLDHTDLDLLVRANSFYEPIDVHNDPELSTFDAGLEACHISELSKTSQVNSTPSGLATMFMEKECACSDTESNYSDDPALMVVPRSSKSLSGVSRHRDFIRGLPVHLAKKILGLLDKASLRGCRDVSQHWRCLTEETLEDLQAMKTVQNQAMMMQSNTTSGVSPVYAKICEVLVPIRDDEKHMHHGDTFYKIRRERVFEAVYTGIRTRPEQMEERNVYCGVYNVLVLLDRDDPFRVAHYSGGQLVALGSKDRTVRLLDVGTVKEVCPLIKGHAGSIRALLLCEERGLVISASYDLSIRCWNVKTGVCMMLFRGHLAPITCLDMDQQGTRLVSGAKDCKVKVWDLQTGKCYEKLKFKHRKPIQCVKIDKAQVVSSCDRGLVKVWGLEPASLLKVIDAHQGSVKSLFFDSWHILSGGLDGQVMAWSTNCDVKKCLMTFHHPQEVLALTLLYLRVITGCADGKIRIFNFLTGDCLRVIKAGGQNSPVLSLHAHDNNLLVNTRTSVLLYQFARVHWDYSSGEREVMENMSVPKGLLRPLPVWAERTAQVGSSNHKIFQREGKKPVQAPRSHHARSRSAPSMRRVQAAQEEWMRSATWSELRSPPASAGHARHTPRTATSSARGSVMTNRWLLSCSEKAARQRVQRRGPHRPATTEHVLLKVNASQQHRRSDPAAANMELNGGVRDAWGPPPPPPSQDTATDPPKPRLQPPSPPPRPCQAYHGMTKTYVPLPSPDGPPSLPSPGLVRPRGSGGVAVRQVGAFTTTAAEDARAPRMFMRTPLHRRHVSFELDRKPRPSTHNPLDPFRERGAFRLYTDSQLQDHVRALSCTPPRGPAPRDRERDSRRAWQMRLRGVPANEFTRKDQVYAPELGPGVYI